MKILETIRRAYADGKPDPEAAFFLDHFDERVGSIVLEVGSHDAPIASMLADAGFETVGVDLRPYDHKPVKHWHMIGDFCDMPNAFWDRWRGKFDTVVSVSAIEHFGLGTYGDRGERPYLDVIAARHTWELLKDGGTCWLQVPIGNEFVVVSPHWRVYDWKSINERLIQDFVLEEKFIRVCENFRACDGREYRIGASLHDALELPPAPVGFPGVSVLLKLRKVLRKG